MKAKRYESRFEDYGDLLAQIKEEMGSDVLVQTRRFQKGGFFGLFGSQEMVEVLAAPKPVARDTVEISADARKDSKPAAVAAIGAAAARSIYSDSSSPQAEPKSVAHTGSAVMDRAPDLSPSSVKQELRELKQMVDGLARKMNEIGAATAVQSPPNNEALKTTSGAQSLTALETEALSVVVSWDIHPQRALKLVKKALSESPLAADTISAEMLLKRVKKAIVGEILLADGLKMPVNGKGMVAAFIGATGVGKTTTIAKLAAQYHVREEKKVALVSLDTYRVAAPEQLRVYADIMKIPITIVYNAEEFGEACAKFREDHIVFVDTAGRSPFNEEHLAELREYFRVSPPDSVQLVVDACTKADDIRIMLEKFSGIGFDHIVISKLDETGSLGSVYTINCLTNRPISFFTVGQAVPDDIRPASVEFIQKWINTGKV